MHMFTWKGSRQNVLKLLCERKFMDQQNYELDQTGAEETPKKKKGSTVKGIVIGVIGTLLISWTGINVACLATNSQILITNKESADDGEGRSARRRYGQQDQ